MANLLWFTQIPIFTKGSLSLSLSLYIYIYVYTSLSLSLYIYTYLYIFVFIYTHSYHIYLYAGHDLYHIHFFCSLISYSGFKRCLTQCLKAALLISDPLVPPSPARWLPPPLIPKFTVVPPDSDIYQRFPPDCLFELPC